MSQPPPVVIRPTFSSLTGVDDLTAIEALSGTGLAARTGSNTWALRTLTGPAAGITVTNGDGASGNPTLALANDLAAYEGLSSTGMVARTGDGTAAARTITGTSDSIDVTNGSGVSGNPTLAVSSTYAGGTSITTVGTIATGTWNGTTIGVSKGGTGLTATPTNGQLPVGNGTGYTLATLTAGTGVSITNGSGSITIASTSSDATSKNLLINGGFDIWQRGSAATAAVTGNLTSGSASVTSVSSVAALSVGMTLSGTGVTAGTTILSIDSSTSFTMSANATATNSTVSIQPGVDDNMSSGADRWFFMSDGTRLTGLGERATSSTSVSGFLGKFTNTSSGRCGIAQWVEAKASRSVRSKSVYFNSTVYADNNAITVRCAIIGWTGTANTLGASRDMVNDWTSGTFTTGNFFKSTNFEVIATGSATCGSSGVTLSCTGTASSNVNNIAVLIWKDAANAIPLSVWDCDLYAGSTARTFVPLGEAEELAECEHFYYKTFALTQQPVANIGNNQGVEQIYPSTTFGGNTIRYRQRMHRIPTMTIYNPQSASAGPSGTGTARDFTSSANRTVVLGTSTDTGVTAEITSGVVADTRNVFHFVADAEIQ